jgi:hypothetical protein
VQGSKTFSACRGTIFQHQLWLFLFCSCLGYDRMLYGKLECILLRVLAVCTLLPCQAELADVKNFNFDHPDAFDTPALLECVNGLKQGCSVNVPTYDFSQHKRGTETKRVSSTKASEHSGRPCGAAPVACHICLQACARHPSGSDSPSPAVCASVQQLRYGVRVTAMPAHASLAVCCRGAAGRSCQGHHP